MIIEVKGREWAVLIVVLILLITSVTAVSWQWVKHIDESVRAETIYYVSDIDTLEKMNSSGILIKDKISCKSDSMGLVMNCDDIIYSTPVGKKTKLREGQIYSYRKNSGTNVIHRLVKDCTKGCFGYIFKGDNNYVADKVVNKSQIVKQVYQIRYG